MDIKGLIFSLLRPAPPAGYINLPVQTDTNGPNTCVSVSAPILVGDSGSGGAAGLVPAPAAGDAAAGKFLKADGSWGSGGGSATFGGDLATVDSTHQKVVGLNQTPFDTSVSLLDGMLLMYKSSTGKWTPIVDRIERILSVVAGKPGAGQVVGGLTASLSTTFPANFGSPVLSYGSVGTNPASTATYNVYKNNATLVGTVSISTSGVFTFATTSGVSFSLNPGDRLTIVAPGAQDANLSDVIISLNGYRTGVAPTGTVSNPILNWRGAYNGATAYNAYDMVSYNGSSYICILPTTGNLPTNTTYWNLLAQAGTNGVLGISDVQNQVYTYVTGAGSANVYTATPGTAYGSLTQGQKIAVKISASNTGASTLNVNSLGAVAIKKVTSAGIVDPVAGDLQNNGIYEFTYNTTGPCWQMTGGGGGSSSGLVLLEEYTASTSASINFTTRNASGQSGASFQSDFDLYQLEIIGLIPATSGAGPLLRFTANGGSTFDTSNIHDWGQTNCQLGATGVGSNAQGSVDGILIWGDGSRNGPSSSATPGLVCTLKIFDPLSSSNYKMVNGTGVGQYNPNGNRYMFEVGGIYRSATAQNGCQVKMTSGNITSGQFRLFGVAK